MKKIIFILSAVLISLSFTGCNPNPDDGDGDTPEYMILVLVYMDSQIVIRIDDYWNQGVETATVSVNGTSFSHVSSGRYEPAVPMVPAYNTAYNYSISIGSFSASGTVNTPSSATAYTSSFAGITHDAADPLSIAWTSSYTPDFMSLYCDTDGNAGGSFDVLDIGSGETSFDIPGGTFDASATDVYFELTHSIHEEITGTDILDNSEISITEYVNSGNFNTT